MSETRTIIGIFRLRLVDLMVHAICMYMKKEKAWRFMIVHEKYGKKLRNIKIN